MNPMKMWPIDEKPQRAAIDLVREDRLAPPLGLGKDKYIEWMGPRQWIARLAPGRTRSAALGPYRASAMDRTSVVNYCLGLLSLLILQGVLSVDGRSTFNPGELAK